ncbi:olfactory receptor 1019-like [Rhinatrema bivittatum]|uniref:olfactory receptor 1019-like n=1 Tax=Rhinatrema bivittatum TaxID=194408 RepID=UPI00112CC413|nr:olfactory receptor 1019-like [Rhinatrema bivittatum]
MERGNQTQVTEFLILGFSNHPDLQVLLFVVFLCIYLVNLTGNLVILTLVCIDPQLHKPMYFFLSNLALLDICFTSTTFPRMLVSFVTEDRTISFSSCLAQLYFFLSFASTEFFLLTAMAYDRYAAICNPLRYHHIMNRRVCVQLVAASWITGLLDIAPHTAMTSQLLFCDSHLINHFCCDLTALIELSCSDTSAIEMLVLTENMCLVTGCFLLTLMSYVYIICAIRRIRSAEGRRKAFSTCSSHLVSVTLLYGTVFCVYMRPASLYSMDQNKLSAVLYNAVVPMLNPIIYSLKNKEVKRALRNIKAWKIILQT